jgi:hypothetical protein
MACKALHQAAGTEPVEALVFERGRERREPRLIFSQRDRSDHRAEHQPGRGLVLVGAGGPLQPHAAHQPAVDPDRIRPVERDRLFRRRMHRQRVREGGGTGIDGAPCLPERLVRLQHHGELREVETADMNQRAGTFLGRNRGRMRHRVADLAQGHEAEQRRQVEGRRDRHGVSRIRRVPGDVIFVWNTYNLVGLGATIGIARNP